MPGTFLNYPFDEELFLANWMAAYDPVNTALIESGVLQRDQVIERLIAGGSNLYTIPFYNVLGGSADNYDGATNITVTAPTGGSQTGVVYGRAHAWKDQDFVHDFGNGVNPTKQISSQVGRYWLKQRQSRLLGILSALFGISDDNTDAWDAWQQHTLSLALAASGTVSDANLVDECSAATCAQRAVGDRKDAFSLAIMHSVVALRLEKLQLLSYRKYTDSKGIERKLPIADWNGYTVIVTDQVPHAVNSTTSAMEYTTYLAGVGAIRYGAAKVRKPVETDRVSLTDGGYDVLITRLRETLHPNGFTFGMPNPAVISPDDSVLATAARWSLCGIDPKAISLARIVSNG